jgi:AraC family transcriptional regulator
MVEEGQMLLLGFSFFGDPFRISGGWTEENEIGRLWQRFMAYLGQHQHRIAHAVTGVAYEVHIEHEETMQTGEYEVFVGLEVETVEDVPVELVVKILPPATYAVLTLQGEQITCDWHNMITEWMDRAGYERAYPYGFQRYDERFKGVDRIDESVLDVYVPVELRGSTPH